MKCKHRFENTTYHHCPDCGNDTIQDARKLCPKCKVKIVKESYKHCVHCGLVK